jgi:hypothetical protein
MAKAANKNTSKSVKSAKNKVVKAKKNIAPKAKKNKADAPKVKRPPLSEAQVKALLVAHPELRAFRSGTEEGRAIVRKHLTSGKAGDDAAKFAHTMQKKGLSYREIEAGMGLAHHNGNSAYRLVNRGRKLKAAETRHNNKNSVPAPKEAVETVAEVAPTVEAVVPIPTPEVTSEVTPTVETVAEVAATVEAPAAVETEAVPA